MPEHAKPVSNATLQSQLNWRYATKKFDPARKISAEDWATLEQALILSPSSYGLQPWKFLVVADPAVRAKLLPASWGQTQITEASHLVVFALIKNVGAEHLDKFVARTAEVRGVPTESLAGLRKMVLGSLSNAGGAAAVDAWQSRQIFIALGQFLTAAAMLGIDACPMEGFEPAKYDEILGLSARGLTATVAATAGYRAADDKYAKLAKVRFRPEDVIERL